MDAFRNTEDVVFGNADNPAGDRAANVADALVAALRELGVRQAFGVSGAAIANLWRATSLQLDTVHFRHEAGAAFAAVEAYFAAGDPVVVFTTTGPGITNALTGILAGRDEGAKLILVSAYSAAANRGRFGIQETSGRTLPVDGLFNSGPLLDYGCILESPLQLPQVVQRLAHGLGRQGGFVAHVCLPADIQHLPAAPLPRKLRRLAKDLPADDVVEQCAQALAMGSFAIWVGFGARNASDSIRVLAEKTGAAVMCSPRGKGIFPEDHPQFVGVTGLAGHASVFDYMAAAKPDRILVLGTRLGEATSFWNKALIPPQGFVHVDINPEVPGVAYPDAKTLAVRADIDAFVSALAQTLPKGLAASRTARLPRPDWGAGSSGGLGRVRPEALMAAVQRKFIDGSDVIVMAESGNASSWTTRMLRFSAAGRFRVSTGTGAVGHMCAGVVGAALATEMKALAIVGDGALLMNNEINTAVKYQAPAAWIVLNDGRYNMCFQGLAMLHMKGPDALFPPVDFAAIARAMGAEAVRVTTEAELDAALAQCMAAKGPFLVDVHIDADRVAPSGARNKARDSWFS